MSLHLLLIWYLILISGLQMNTYTNAAFNGLEDIILPIKTADIFHPNPDQDPVKERVDKSSLENMKGKEAFESCNSITAWVSNKGSGDMLGTSVFYVYYDPVNNPVNGNEVTGTLVFNQGIIPALKIGQSTKLTFNLEKNEFQNGKYKFVFFQRDGHPGNNNGMFPINNAAFFSEVISVNGCTNIQQNQGTQNTSATEGSSQGIQKNSAATEDSSQNTSNDLVNETNTANKENNNLQPSESTNNTNENGDLDGTEKGN